MADRATADRAPVAAPVKHVGREGFLPITTNTFDRYFISAITFVAISLLWMRFVEPLGFSIWIAVAISVVLGFFIVTRG